MACAFFSLLLAPPGWAALGSDLASVQADQQAWGASTAQTALVGGTLYTQTLPEGGTVRQFADTNGVVFAVAWSGPVLPDFARLLGVHYAAYTEALHLQKRSISLQSAGLVIESGGMMRAFSGRAYLPPKLPAGLSARDIR